MMQKHLVGIKSWCNNNYRLLSQNGNKAIDFYYFQYSNSTFIESRGWIFAIKIFIDRFLVVKGKLCQNVCIMEKFTTLRSSNPRSADSTCASVSVEFWRNCFQLHLLLELQHEKMFFDWLWWFLQTWMRDVNWW